MSEEKKKLIASVIAEYGVQTADDLQDALKDLLGDTLEEMLQAEMTAHLGYKEHERTGSGNARNGKKPKTVRSKYGEVEVDVPQDRNSTFAPKVVSKRKKDIFGVEEKIIAMYAKGLTTRQISEHIMDIYGFEVSEGFVSDVTDRILPQIEEWQQRPLSEIYPIVFIDAVHFSVKTEGIVKKLAAYVVLGIDREGYKEVLGLYIGENESSKYWLNIFNELKHRGVKDILVVSADGLSGIKEA
jgi:transposase-like protein